MSNLGTWVHDIGAGWLMSELDGTPENVAAVRTAMTIPVTILAIPAGVLADRFDRRKLLILTQLTLLSCATTLAFLTHTERITPSLLLLLTFAMGLSLVVHVPTWQAAIPELVPREQLPQAVALGSVSFNLARAIGPAIGGYLIGLTGVWIAFAINAVSFAGVLLVLFRWRRESSESPRGLSFWVSMVQGVRYVYRKQSIRRVLIGVILFVIPASAFWALLPLVVKVRLQWGPSGLGLLTGLFGIGAVIAASLLPNFKSKWGAGKTFTGAMLLFATGFLTSSLFESRLIVSCTTLLMGGCWMMTLTTLNASIQIQLPRRMRARGVSCYLTAIAFSMAVGSMIWGQVAGAMGIGSAQAIAATILLLTTAIGATLRIGRTLR